MTRARGNDGNGARRVLHVESGKHLYGGALQVCYLIRGLAERGWENVLACSEGSAIATAVGDGAQVVPLKLRGELNLPTLARLHRLIGATRPALVHAHSRRGADLWAALAAHSRGVPALVTRRVDSPEPGWWARLKYGLFDDVVAISDGIRRALLAAGVPADKVVTIRSAIDTEVYCPRRSRRLKGEFGLPDDVVAVGMVAQFIPRKGHAHLLTAAPVVIAAVPNVRFILFGRGPEEGAVRKQIAADGLTGHVVVAGFRDDLDRLLPDLDVMVHPVEREGLGVALLQAAACGVPVVASAVGGVPEAVRDGESGLLVPAGDAGALARALIDLLADAERRQSMSRRSREMALREFAISVMVERHLDLYDALLADAAHPALYRGHA